MEAPGTSSLLPALADAVRTRIGDPWRGTYHVAIAADDRAEAEALIRDLGLIGVAAQINERKSAASESRRWIVAIYDPGSQARLLETMGDELDERQRGALDRLIRARGPISEQIIRTIRLRHDRDGMSFTAIAHAMNDNGVIDGMGGKGWTAKKVEAAYRGLGRG